MVVPLERLQAVLLAGAAGDGMGGVYEGQPLDPERPLPPPPWRFSDAESGVRGVAPYRGEHNRELLREVLGYDDTRIDALEAAGILSARKPR